MKARKEEPKMMRIILDRATIEMLHDLREATQFFDETGWLLGKFIPEACALAEVAVSADSSQQPEEKERLGEEISIFGYEMDLE
jgi:hypothetical protein